MSSSSVSVYAFAEAGVGQAAIDTSRTTIDAKRGGGEDGVVIVRGGAASAMVG
jgi:hypothetical protein